MSIITINRYEITLGCFVNLHIKMACVYNGIFAKINIHYHAIIHWTIAINAL